MSIQALDAVIRCDGPALGLDTYSRMVLMILANCASDDGTNAYPSVATIAAQTDMSERKVQQCLRALEEARLIKATAVSGGRFPSVYAVNLVRLRAHPRAAIRPLGAGAPDFGDGSAGGEGGAGPAGATPHAVRGSGRANPARHDVNPARQVVNPAQRAPEPLEPSGTSARPGARDPDGRAPGRRREGVSDNGSALDGAGRRKIPTVHLGVGAVRSRAFDVWASLVAALVAKREAEAVRAWVAGPGVMEIAPGHRAVRVATGTVGRRAREALEPILQRHGWRVVEAGTAWAGEGVAA